MTTIRNSRRFLNVAFTVAVLTAGFFASVSPSYAIYYCNWTPRGTVCTR